MLYKPIYCNNCGVKIERIEWFPWTSRNFCEVCEKEHKIYDRLPLILGGTAVLTVILSFGSYLLPAGKTAPPVEDRLQVTTLKRNAPPANQRTAPDRTAKSAVVENANEDSIVQKNGSSETVSPNPTLHQSQPPTSRQNADVPVVKTKDPVYFCGAQTKKGTPCSRRVKGGGRCWQHEGQPAMLPPEKLLIN